MKTAEPHTTATQHRPEARSAEGPFFQRDAERGFFGGERLAEPFFSPTTIQPKLKIGAPDDAYEREADQVADQVVQRLAQPATETITSEPNTGPARAKPVSAGPASVHPVQRQNAPEAEEEELQTQEEEPIRRKAIFESGSEEEGVQRKCATCAAEEEGMVRRLPARQSSDPLIQRKCAACEAQEEVRPKRLPAIQRAGDGSMTTSDAFSSRLQASKGGGAALPKSTRTSMESAMGSDFSGVRVHTGSEAAGLSESIGAQAFTHGSDVYFNRGKYEPGSQGGQRLLAHELVHTVQQGGGDLVQKVSGDGEGGGAVRDAARALATAGARAAVESTTIINKTGIVYNSEGANVYEIPVRPELGESYEENQIKALEFNTRLNVLEEISGGWYKIQEKSSGATGFINKSLIRINLPHEFASYHIVQNGETAIGIAEKYYRGVSVMEDDLRDYVDYLVSLNKGVGDTSKGIYKQSSTDEWDQTQVRANYHIWITPSGTAYNWVKENGKYAGHNVVMRTADEALEWLLSKSLTAFLVEAVENMPLEERAKLARQSLREQNAFLKILAGSSGVFSTTVGLMGTLPGLPRGLGLEWQTVLFEFALNVIIGRNQAMLAMSDEELDSISLNILRAQLDPEYYYGLITGVGGGIINWFVDIGEMISTIAKIAYFFTPIGMAQWIIEHQEGIEKTKENLEKIAEYIYLNKDEIIEEFSSLTIEDVRSGIKKFVAGFAQSVGGSIAQKLLAFSQKSPYEIGYGVGEIIGYLIPEILLAVFSEAIGNVIKGALKVVSKLFKWLMKGGKAILRSLSKIRKTIGFIDEILDIFRRIKLGGSKNKFITKLDDFFQGLKRFFLNRADALRKIQRSIVDEVERGGALLRTNKRKGNYGEMKMDIHVEGKGYRRVSNNRVTSLDQKIEKGIDGVYENATPPPKYVIAESKYGSSRLGKTKDGKQMSDTWILGSDRLENAVGSDMARKIQSEMIMNPGNVERVLVHVDETGKVTTFKLDGLGNKSGSW